MLTSMTFRRWYSALSKSPRETNGNSGCTVVDTTCFRSASSHLNNAACSWLSNAETFCTTSAPHWSVGSSGGIGARFQIAGVRRYGWRSSRTLSVACSGPSMITLCCQVHTLRHSGVEMSSGPGLCESPTAATFDTRTPPFWSSDEGRKGILPGASTLSTSAQGPVQKRSWDGCEASPKGSGPKAGVSMLPRDADCDNPVFVSG